MVTTHIIKIKHGVLSVTGVYLRDVTDIVFVILHLSVSCLSVCSSCQLERWTHDRNIARLNPGWSGGRIFFSRVNFVC